MTAYDYARCNVCAYVLPRRMTPKPFTFDQLPCPECGSNDTDIQIAVSKPPQWWHDAPKAKNVEVLPKLNPVAQALLIHMRGKPK